MTDARSHWWMLTSFCAAVQVGSGLVAYLSLRTGRFRTLGAVLFPVGYIAFVAASLGHVFVLAGWEYLTFNGCYSLNPDPSLACSMSHAERGLRELFSFSNLLWPFVGWFIFRPPREPAIVEVVATLSRGDG